MDGEPNPRDAHVAFESCWLALQQSAAPPQAPGVVPAPMAAHVVSAALTVAATAVCVHCGIAVEPPPISGTLQPVQTCSFCKFVFVHWNIAATPMHIPQL